MVWICVIIFNLLVGIIIGATLMYYKDRNLLKNQKILHDELQNNKMKLHEYQKRLSNHFTYNIELLDKIAENYRSLYQNMTKNASFFLPSPRNKDNISSFHMNDKYKKDDEYLPVKVPLDYSEKSEMSQKNHNHIE